MVVYVETIKEGNYTCDCGSHFHVYPVEVEIGMTKCPVCNRTYRVHKPVVLNFGGSPKTQKRHYKKKSAGDALERAERIKKEYKERKEIQKSNSLLG